MRQPGDDADKIVDAVLLCLLTEDYRSPETRLRFGHWVGLLRDTTRHRMVLTTWLIGSEMFGRMTIRGDDWVAKVAIVQDRVYWVERPQDAVVIDIMLSYQN